MSEKFDHAAEATRLVDATNQPASTFEGSNPEATLMVATAQVHATLALVEQQRLANLIAFHATALSQELGGFPRTPSGVARTDRVAREVQEGLGL